MTQIQNKPEPSSAATPATATLDHMPHDSATVPKAPFVIVDSFENEMLGVNADEFVPYTYEVTSDEGGVGSLQVTDTH